MPRGQYDRTRTGKRRGRPSTALTVLDDVPAPIEDRVQVHFIEGLTKLQVIVPVKITQAEYDRVTDILYGLVTPE